MPFIDHPITRAALAAAIATAVAALAACAEAPTTRTAAPPPVVRTPAEPARAPAPTPPAPAAAPERAAARAPATGGLGPPATPRSAQELRLQMARRLVAAHPDTSYTGRPPERLLAIPVLEIELNADGSVRNISVLRKPSTGNEATVLAIAAVRRAAPYGDVSRLPKPWKVVETFLFDDNLRFKPRTLDQN